MDPGVVGLLAFLGALFCSFWLYVIFYNTSELILIIKLAGSVFYGIVAANYRKLVKGEKAVPDNGYLVDWFIIMLQYPMKTFGDESLKHDIEYKKKMWGAIQFFVKIIGYFVELNLKICTKFKHLNIKIDRDGTTTKKLNVDLWSNFDHNNLFDKETRKIALSKKKQNNDNNKDLELGLPQQQPSLNNNENEKGDILILHMVGGGGCFGTNKASSHYAKVFLNGYKNTSKKVTFALVDFRKAFEQPYPAGVNDCYTSLRYFIGLDKYKSIYLMVYINSFLFLYNIYTKYYIIIKK